MLICQIRVTFWYFFMPQIFPISWVLLSVYVLVVIMVFLVVIRYFVEVDLSSWEKVTEGRSWLLE